jgi:hypothetical protein
MVQAALHPFMNLSIQIVQMHHVRVVKLSSIYINSCIQDGIRYTVTTVC